MSETNRRIVNILTAIFENAEIMAKTTGIEPEAAEKLMRTGELRLKEFGAIKRILGLTDERIFFIGFAE